MVLILLVLRFGTTFGGLDRMDDKVRSWPTMSSGIGDVFLEGVVILVHPFILWFWFLFCGIWVLMGSHVNIEILILSMSDNTSSITSIVIMIHKNSVF